MNLIFVAPLVPILKMGLSSSDNGGLNNLNGKNNIFSIKSFVKQFLIVAFAAWAYSSHSRDHP